MTRTYVINPFVSEAQRKACYAADDPNWDCAKWERHTPKKKLPSRVRNRAAKRLPTRKGKPLRNPNVQPYDPFSVTVPLRLQLVEHIKNCSMRVVRNCAVGQIRGADGRCGPGSGGVDIPRRQMPQITSDDLQHFLGYVRARGIGVTETEVTASDLKPTQKEFRQERVDAIPEEKLRDPILTSSDNHVLDGTHRWIKHWQLDKSRAVPVLRLGLKLQDALQVMREYPRAKFVENFDPDQPRDEGGRWTAVGGAVSAMQKAGASIGHAEHAVKSYVADKLHHAISKLPAPAQSAVHASLAVTRVAAKGAFASWTAGQALAERVARERGHDEEQARRLRGVLSAVDMATFKPLSLALHASGMSAATLGAVSFIPPASAAYLAYSTARDPMATLRAAKGAIREVGHSIGHAARVVGGAALTGLEIAAQLTGNFNPNHDEQGRFAEAAAGKLSEEAEKYRSVAWHNGGGGRKAGHELPPAKLARVARSYAGAILSAERSGKHDVAQELTHAAPHFLPGARLFSSAGAVEPYDGGRHEGALAGHKGDVRVARAGIEFPSEKSNKILGGGGEHAVVLRARAEALTKNAAEDVVQLLSASLEQHNFDDWYIALLSAAMDESETMNDAITLAEQASQVKRPTQNVLLLDPIWQKTLTTAFIQGAQRAYDRVMQAAFHFEEEDRLKHAGARKQYIVSLLNSHRRRLLYDALQQSATDVIYAKQSQERLIAAANVGVIRAYEAGMAAVTYPTLNAAVRIGPLSDDLYDKMDDVTKKETTEIARIIKDGVASGAGWEKISSEIRKRTEFDEQRSDVTARTELSRAEAELLLNDIEDREGYDPDKPAVVFVRGDEGPCIQCEMLEGDEFTVEDARGVIPVHPNCMCHWEEIEQDAPGEDEDEDVQNRFCPTGPGGGVDPTCPVLSPEGREGGAGKGEGTTKESAIKAVDSAPDWTPHKDDKNAPREAVQMRGKMMATPLPVDTSEKLSDKMRHTMDTGERKEVEVAVDKIIARQTGVSKDSVKHFIKTEDRQEGAYDRPVVVKIGSKLYLHDGTHRVSADKLAGRKTVRVTLYSRKGRK